MKICFLAPANNHHTKKWCEYFLSKGHKITVISFVPGNIDNVDVHYINCSVKTDDSDIKKIKYLLKINKIKKIIKKVDPDIINAHYATSYGMVAALCNLKKYILSVWGTDVYIFPKKSIIHKIYFKYLINKAPYIFATSNALKKELKKYTEKQIYVTPFGVKMDLFNSNKRTRKDNDYIIGTVKTLKEKYGIRYIIEAVKIIKNKIPNLKVVIAGSGNQEFELKELAKKNNVDIDWLGTISQEQAAITWANMDLALIPSIDNSESFGVSVIEAEASQIPVIITDLPGLLETTTDKSRIVIPRKDSLSLANAIIELYNNPKKREQMGINGRKYVEKKYEYNKCFEKIEKIYDKIINSKM